MSKIAKTTIIIPYLIPLLLICLQCNVGFFASHITPNLLLPVVYYFAIYRSLKYQLGYYFILGLVYDSLYGTLLGQTSCFLIITHIILTPQKKYLNFHNFLLCWLSFFAFAMLATLLEKILYIQQASQWLIWTNYWSVVLITTAFYPAIIGLLQFNERTNPQQSF